MNISINACTSKQHFLKDDVADGGDFFYYIDYDNYNDFDLMIYYSYELDRYYYDYYFSDGNVDWIFIALMDHIIYWM